MRLTSFILGLFLIGFMSLSPVNAQQEFEQWKHQQQQEFREFRDARDKEFMNYLQQEWKDFQAYQGLVRDKTPKPEDIPTAETVPEEKPDKPETPTISPPPRVPAPPETPSTVPVPPEPPEHPEKYQDVKFQFFGTPVRVHYDQQLAGSVDENINEESISRFWKSLGTADTKSLLDQTQKYHKMLKLNDWGYTVFAHQLGSNIYGDSPNSETLFTWFVLLKSGYDVRIGYNENTTYLLVPSENMLYNIPYLTMDGARYYIVPLDDRSSQVNGITTYEGKYPGESRSMNFRLSGSPAIAGNLHTRILAFDYLGGQYSVELQMNRNITAFYNTYPQTDIPIYFQSTISPQTAKSLVDELQPIIEGKTEIQAVNLLLRFVQTAFEYQTDVQQFGKENYLFPEETLYYSASDCEDRSALFAYLVRNLLGLEVIGLDYPGHIATAVRFSGDVGRDSIIHAGKTYTVCDPTYIMAEYGMTMPIVQDKEVTVFTFD